MILFLGAAVIGLAVGKASGGSLRRLADLHFVAAPLVWIAVAAQVALGYPPARQFPSFWRTAIVLLSFALAGLFLALNLRARATGLRAGLVLLSLGWLLNVAVVAANGGMPVSSHAVAVSALPPDVEVAEGHMWKHVDADSTTRLRPLGDVLAVPGVPAVFSGGDISMIAGIVVTLAAACRRREERLPAAAPAW